MAEDQDVLIQEIVRDRRARRPLLIAASVAIIGLCMLGIGICFASLAR